MYYFEKNLQGDIVAVYNADGTKICSYTYDAWGVCTTTYHVDYTHADYHIGQDNPFRYRGYYYDWDTGFYYLQSRYYNPAWGRFISADGYVSTGTGLLGYNMYAYCSNNPIMLIDPTGTYGESCVAFGAYGNVNLLNPLQNIIGGGAGGTIVAAVAFTVILLQNGGTRTVAYASPVKSKIKEETKEGVANPPNIGTTYYHVTTRENAEAIIATQTLVGSLWEGGYVYAWKTKPNQYAIENSGAHFGVIISFKTNASFTMDPGISDPKVQIYGPVVSTVPGPIVIWDVKIVEG